MCIYGQLSLWATKFFPPSDVIQEMVGTVIDRYNIEYIWEKRKDASPDDMQQKKGKPVMYDRKHVLECVMSDWFDPMLRFDNRQFE